jgi:hypothetical protein
MNRSCLFLIALLYAGTAACGSDPRSSLVGKWQIADDAELGRDAVTLSFRKETDTDYLLTLSYSLHPNGSLTIEKGRDHAVCCFGGIDRHLVDHRWQAQLPRNRQILIRRMLARLRPRTLSKDFPFALPRGCSFTNDSRSWAGVSFVQGNVGGLFLFQPGCSGPGADNAKHLVRSVIAMLPSVDGSTGFLEPPHHD